MEMARKLTNDCSASEEEENNDDEEQDINAG
jgi:hypothetical protein